jgi:hypothetical protein
MRKVFIYQLKKTIIMGKRPIGVTVVAALAMMSAIVLGFFQFIVFALSAVGGPPSSGSQGSGLPLIFLTPLFLAVCGFSISIGQLEGSKWAYYASIVFWIVLLACFGLLAYVVDFLNGIIWLDGRGDFSSHGFLIFMVTIAPLLYSAASLTYFLTKTPRVYFQLSKKNTC